MVIDSLKKVMDLGDINFGVGPMGTVMQLMQSIAAKYDVAVLWIHHTKPGAKDGISVSGGNSNIYQIPYCVHCLFKKEVQGLGQVTRWIVEKYDDDGPLKDCWLTTGVSPPVSLGSSI